MKGKAVGKVVREMFDQNLTPESSTRKRKSAKKDEVNFPLTSTF